VTVHIELEWVRLLRFGTIRRFLTDVALHISKYVPGTLEYLQTNQAIDVAMTSFLWETQEMSGYGMENEPHHGHIEVQFSGVPRFYFDRRDCEAFQKLKADAAAIPARGAFAKIWRRE
jgi:hypothetical protein